MFRKKGFSLVEMLIVLAVMATLIATITPVAMNAIRKAKAVQVAFNLKVLVTGMENKILLDSQVPENIKVIGRDIDVTNYGVAYTSSGGHYVVVAFTSSEVHFESVRETLKDATNTSSVIPGDAQYLPGGLQTTSNAKVFYRVEFDIY
ncbi:MAG: type II secretion system protein [Thermotogae bacterium]|uniref:type II secretion system protein n=1 Tax=Kosmotoga sp. TaxID=1955248 RepID=UPI000F0F2A99|nr:type II secretion system protein [Kosmotoga sp.]MBO8166963.1 type II secretion system protein [Kosmotoga sp.]RKX51131.1 MAG: type II secretion system protein [Thermotogota bacterium]